MSAQPARRDQLVRLDSICKIIQGGRLKLSGKDFIAEGGYPAYGAGGHNGNLPNYEFEDPAIVLSAIGARCGKCFQPSGKWSSLANTSVFFPDRGQVDLRFLWYQLNDERSWHRSGTAQPYIKPSDIKGRLVYLPPLPVQKRITSILDSADELRSKRHGSISQLDCLLQSTFRDMFGDPIANPLGWESVSLEAVCRPRQWPTIRKTELLESGYPVFGANGKIGFYSRYNHVAPTVLITCRGATCGTINVSDSKSYVTGNAMALDDPDPDRVDIRYLEHALRDTDFGPVITGVAQPQITRESLKRLKLPLPPLAMQRRFAAIVAAVESHRTLLRKHYYELESLFASLKSRSFRGEL